MLSKELVSRTDVLVVQSRPTCTAPAAFAHLPGARPHSRVVGSAGATTSPGLGEVYVLSCFFYRGKGKSITARRKGAGRGKGRQPQVLEAKKPGRETQEEN